MSQIVQVLLTKHRPTHGNVIGDVIGCTTEEAEGLVRRGSGRVVKPGESGEYPGRHGVRHSDGSKMPGWVCAAPVPAVPVSESARQGAK